MKKSIVIKELFVLMMVLFCVWGCDFKHTTHKPVFKNVYDTLVSEKQSYLSEKRSSQLLSLTADRMPLSAFLRWIADNGHVSVVCEANLDEKPVSVEFYNQPVSIVLSMVARRLSVEVTQQGDVFYLGTLRREDRGLLVRKVARLSKEDLKEAVGIMLSEVGRSVVYADGLVVVGDRVQVLERINNLLNKVENSPSDSWVVQLHLINIEDRVESELGLDLRPTAELSFQFANASNSIVDMFHHGVSALKVDAGFQAVLKASSENSGMNVIASPLFLVLDGGQATYKGGQVVPVPEKTVSPEGTVTTSGYTMIETGLDVTIGVRDVGSGGAFCNVEMNMSDVVGYVQEAPITSQRFFSTAAVLRSGGVYLLGSLHRKEQSNGISGILQAAFRKVDAVSTVQIWARIYRISGEYRTHNGGCEPTSEAPIYRGELIEKAVENSSPKANILGGTQINKKYFSDGAEWLKRYKPV